MQPGMHAEKIPRRSLKSRWWGRREEVGIGEGCPLRQWF